MSAKTGFDHIAGSYDKTFTETATGRGQRAIVQDYLENKINAGASVLELNCGTGEDAVWLAKHGAQVLATDVSAEMVAITSGKTRQAGLSHLIRTEILDIRALTKERLNAKFDLVLSNFGGLNCLSPDEMRAFGTVLPHLLKPGGLFVAVVMSRFCWWETLYFLLKGRRRAAFRRLSVEAVEARLDERASIPVWYFSPLEFRRFFPDLHVRTVQPVGFWLPPSYLDPLVADKPRLLEILNFSEQKCRGRLWAWGADHFMLAGSFLK
mgnify:CR=1 FL=1